VSGYLLLKTLHIVSATILFGTGIGIAFFKWSVDRTGGVAGVRAVCDKVVLADWLFTTPAIIVQAVTGLALARWVGFPLTHGWLAWAICLYLLAGACWLPVVWLQLRMRDQARLSEARAVALPPLYRSYARAWFWLGVPAFLSLLGVFWLMVAKPA
jgi:uncharacterized membrane protein